jgi:hypothetical protein
MHENLQAIYIAVIPIGHMEKKHRINQYGSMPIQSHVNTQRTIDSFDSLIRERNSAIAELDLAVFKSLLVRLFTVEQLALNSRNCVSRRQNQDQLIL